MKQKTLTTNHKDQSDEQLDEFEINDLGNSIVKAGGGTMIYPPN